MTSSSLRDLDEQLEELANLKLNSKKTGPTVPPKPKKSPVIPQSYAVDGQTAPSFSTPLQGDKNSLLYSNLPPPHDLGLY